MARVGAEGVGASGRGRIGLDRLADGLVMTNHHVAQGQLAKLSTPERDIVTNGFYARRIVRTPLPDLEVLSLQASWT